MTNARDERLQIRLSKEEKEKLKQDAEDHGLPMATYIRAVLLAKKKSEINSR